ncbi:hypothetical protein SAMD00019534_113780 [Acytostelium subglobosum LB1]|uniref:hypothetical protein n=1 Tax=Acytostelium subglobosum LB1 TaxID=1410327 RepID=UPI0006450C03|nr:hypothetical protein SAMD00019534_113780 [Acytostelium subglobosum LB1]GAM28202.1 hypothetical protein SAMD00019534_113780 [Acytostelium subglobosum LB1]|eukprot:XP_012748836.1 hypothetical protein SAMD00019534_113780 [Acytostelium subglobosum LB1]
MYDILKLVESNSYDELEYLLDTWTASPFVKTTITQRLRTVKSVLDSANFDGKTRIIIFVTQSSTKSTTVRAFHLVFKDRRLGMIIMKTIGDVYRRFGVNDDQLIKGGELLANHSLVDYIKYGAIEWFLKSYYPVANIYPDNTKLLTAALIRADTQVMDAPLANPSMNILHHEYDSILQSIVEHHSHCHQDGWERSIDEMLTLNQMSKYKVDGLIFPKVNHPALMYKLITISKDVYPTQHIKVMFKHWISDKEAFDRALGPGPLPSLESHVQPSTQYHVDPATCKFLMKDVMKSLLMQCAENGKIDVFDHIIDRLEVLSFFDIRDFNLAFRIAATNGHLDFVKRLHEIIVYHDAGPRYFHFYPISDVLKKGHEHVADFLLGLPLDNNDGDDYDMDSDGDDYDMDSNDDEDDYDNYELSIGPVIDIHPSILSIGLIQRLLALHQIRFNSSTLLAHAILNQDKAIINLLERSSYSNRFKSDYHFALGAAAITGDVEMAEMIIQEHPDECIPPEYVDKDFKIYRQDHEEDSDDDDEDDEDGNLVFEFYPEESTTKLSSQCHSIA